MVRIPDRPYAHLAAAGRPHPPDAGAAAAYASAGRNQIAARGMDALGDAAARIGEIGLRIAERRDHDLLADAQARYSAAMTEYAGQAEISRQGDGARGFAREYAGQSDRTRDETAKWLKDAGGTERASGAFASWTMQRKSVGGAAAAKFEHAQLEAHGRDLFAASLADIGREVEANPRSWPDAAKRLEESFTIAAGQGIYRPQEAKNAFLAAREKLGAQAFESMYAQDRQAAVRAAVAFGLSPAERARVKKRYAADMRADAALSRAASREKADFLAAGLEDAESLAAYGADAAPLMALGEKLAALGDARGQKVMARAAGYRESAAISRESSHLPLPELAASIEKDGAASARAAEAGDAGALRASEFARETREKIFTRRLAALKADPAGAADERARKLAENESPAQIAAARLAVQAADGLPAPMRKILSGAERETLSQAWKSGGESKMAIFARMQAYGPHAGRALAEIGVNPLEESLARSALASGGVESLEAFRLVCEAWEMPEEALPKLESARLAADLAENSARLSAMRDAVNLMPGNAGARLALSRAEKAAEKLLRMNGGDVDAASSLLDAGVGRLSGSGCALMYEKNGPAGLDGDDLEDALAAARGGRLEAFAEVLPGYAAGEKREERLRSLRKNGIWGNAPDGDGFVFFDPRSQSPIVDGRGEYLRVRPADVPALLMDAREAD